MKYIIAFLVFIVFIIGCTSPLVKEQCKDVPDYEKEECTIQVAVDNKDMDICNSLKDKTKLFCYQRVAL